jgi:hypothetical protein
MEAHISGARHSEVQVWFADRCAEFIGTYFLHRWRLFLSLAGSAGVMYVVYRYTPGTLHTFLALGDFLLLTLPAYLESVQVYVRPASSGRKKGDDMHTSMSFEGIMKKRKRKTVKR